MTCYFNQCIKECHLTCYFQCSTGTCSPRFPCPGSLETPWEMFPISFFSGNSRKHTRNVLKRLGAFGRPLMKTGTPRRPLVIFNFFFIIKKNKKIIKLLNPKATPPNPSLVIPTHSLFSHLKHLSYANGFPWREAAGTEAKKTYLPKGRNNLPRKE